MHPSDVEYYRTWCIGASECPTAKNNWVKPCSGETKNTKIIGNAQTTGLQLDMAILKQSSVGLVITSWCKQFHIRIADGKKECL